jgi:L-threonylcarbamoyladenylate synthase
MPIVAPTPDNIAAAAEALRRGELVSFPTETVYGLGADATNSRAVARVFEAKGRPRFNPLIAHVADLAAAERIAFFPAHARKLAEAFWPGPLTLVLRKRPEGKVSVDEPFTKCDHCYFTLFQFNPNFNQKLILIYFDFEF